MRRTKFTRVFLALAAVAIAACSETATNPPQAFDLKPSLAVSGDGSQSYVLIASGSTLRAGMADEVAAVGGKIVSTLDGIGVIVAKSSDPQFAAKAAKISGIGDVVLDQMVQWVRPEPFVHSIEADITDVGQQSHGPAGIGAHESFRAIQWAPDAISAPAAWDLGYQGEGARVAILDGGVHKTHVDIAPNLDVARSTSFTQADCANPPVPPPPPPPAPPPPPPPAEPPTCNNYDFDTGTFWHGT